MRNKLFLVFVLMFMVASVSASFNTIQTSNPSINSLYSSSDISTYWPSLSNRVDDGMCTAGSDFLVAIPIDGCSPSVVRSDLLAEQNVPVFCKLKAVNVNPLIDVSGIDSISFKGDYPDDVVSVSYHPAKAAIDISRDVLLGNPVVNDIGYVVIVLKKQANESAVSEWVSGNLTATMRYDADDAYGVGQSVFYLNNVDGADWEKSYADNSFWNGKGYLRLMSLDGESARIAIYTDKDQLYTEVKLKTGETSGTFYLPGSYCQSGIKIKLNSVVADEDSAQLDIDGNSVWVRQGSKFLNGACVVNSLNVGYGSAGTITYKCQNNKAVTLSLASRDVAKIGEKQYSLGNTVSSSSGNYYLGYIGGAESALLDDGKITIEAGTNFIVMIKAGGTGTSLDNSKVVNLANVISKFFNTQSTGLKKEALESAIKAVAGSDAIILYNSIGNKNGLDFGGVEDKTIAAESNEEVDASGEIKTYFGKMDSAQKELIEKYPQEGDSEKFGLTAFALEKNIITSLIGLKLSDDSALTELENRAKDIYSNYEEFGGVKRVEGYDYTNAVSTVYVNNEYRRVSLVSLKQTDASEESARFSYNSNSYQEVHEGQIVYTGEQEKSDYFIIKDIQRNAVTVAYYQYQAKTITTTYKGVYTLKEDSDAEIKASTSGDVALYTLSIDDISVVDVAGVSLESQVATSSGANFTYKIGIEKRTISLSPEKALEAADKLNDTINKWEEKNAKFGELIEAWNGVCLITSAALQVKTLFEGFGGASSARKEVMDIYQSECKNNEELSKLESNSKCYAALNANSEIDNDVDAYANAIENVNKEVQGLSITAWQTSSNCKGVNIPVGNQNLNCSDLNSWAEVKAYLLNKYISQDGTASDKLKAKVKTDFETKAETIAREKASLISQGNADKVTSELYSGFVPTYITHQDSTYKNTVEQWSTSVIGADSKVKVSGNMVSLLDVVRSKCDSPNSITDSTPMQYFNYNYQRYLLILTEESVSKSVRCILSIDTDGSGEVYQNITFSSANNADNSKYKYLINMKFVAGTTGTCNTGYSNTTKFTVEYYESGTNKGNPAKVPFDSKGGWYVKASSSVGGMLSNSVKSYDDSGALNNFEICNVGTDKAEGDNDECASFDIDSEVSSRKSVAGCKLSESEIKTLVQDAQSAIKVAQKNYGKKSFVIQVGSRGSIQVIGVEATADLGYECEDFMSPDDCHIIYNVCDPVVCPSSRCDFGGKMKVANVIQSGIVGSLLLCLPNFGSIEDGGVLIPVCLSGLHAGIEGWISILKSQQECLREAAETGAYTGICDEITAVYQCEFFWRQVAPLMDNIVPTIAEAILGTGSKDKGGGEYLTFQDSWDNMEGSIDYFKNTYASTSFRALDFGNVEEFGTELCQNFIGTSIPNSASAFDSLLDPASPYQFYAQFSEIEMTTATVPATSQYKVYYHIYAGNDKGVSYQVYLKDPESLAYVDVSETVYVDTGYVGVGSEIDEAKDFTAPAGYKQLCVTIDGATECGFKSVTTDVGLDLVHDAYVKDQTSATGITTEAGCIEGQSSMYSLLNMNVQEGLDDTLNPDIALSGIIRVCSTKNPGSSSNDSNWKDVGYCGNKDMTCWLDQESLKNGVYAILNATNSVAATNALLEGDSTLTSEDGVKFLKEIQQNITDLDLAANTDKGNAATLDTNLKNKIDAIENSISSTKRLYSNNQNAKLLYLKFTLYQKVVDFLINRASNNKNNPTGGVTGTNAPSVETAVTDDEAAGDGSIDTTIERYSVTNYFIVDGNGNKLTSSDGVNYIVVGSAINKRGIGIASTVVASADPKTGIITPGDENIDELLPIYENYKIIDGKLVLK